MFRHFYDNIPPELSEQFTAIVSKQLINKQISPAAVQGHFLRYKDDPRGAVENAAAEMLTDLENGDGGK
jgi:hypothetical protein